MMNDKDLQRKMKEQMIALLDSYEKMAKNLAEETEHKEVKEFKPKKVSYSEKRCIVKMIDRITDDKSVLSMIGFAGFKDGSGLLFGKTDEYSFDTLSLLIAEAYEQSCDDKTDGVGFEDFLKDLADNARMARILTRGSKNNERD